MRPVPEHLVEALADLQHAEFCKGVGLEPTSVARMPADNREILLAHARKQLEQVQSVTGVELGAPLHLMQPEQAESVGGEDEVEWSRRVVG